MVVVRDKSGKGPVRPDAETAANDNLEGKVVPFDEKAWRREYMRRYMRERRQKMREARK